jgi:cobyrinic acid a,c-diamide synthase
MIVLPRLMIAAPSSGCGKSTLASGLMAAFARKLSVQGFKVGPDYIDPMYHTLACGRPSRNLDAWMLPEAKVTEIFVRHARQADLSLIEGVMGLFDGYAADLLTGSSAGIASLLSAPVILVVDCAKMSGSAAAVVHGFHTLLPQVSLAGVICNRVGSLRHSGWLKEAIENLTGVPVLGCIPRLDDLKVPERHLGLFTVQGREDEVQTWLAQAAAAVTQHVDLERLLEIAYSAPELSAPSQPAPVNRLPQVKLAVARDAAFCFYYEDNLDELRRQGAEIAFFSPLNDDQLPDGAAGLYFGGGYPELYAEALSGNHNLMQQIANCHRQGMPIYAECGGLMYLTQGLQMDKTRYPLAGLLPGWGQMGSRLYMGYRQVELMQPNLLGDAGTILCGHEFHYSRWDNPQPEQAAYRIVPRDGNDGERLEGFSEGNLLASYVHVHFSQNAGLAQQFVQKCMDWKMKQSGGLV